jgi:TonB family protein
MTTTTYDEYRRPFFGDHDPLFQRCLTGSAVVGLAFLIGVLVAPIRKEVVTRIEQLPPRFARLIVDKPKPMVVPTPGPKSPTPGPTDAPGAPATTGVPQPAAPPGPGLGSPGPSKPPGGTPGLAPGIAAGGGAAGRARAQAEVTANVARAAASLEKTLGNLSSSLRSTSTEGVAAPGRGRPRRGIRAARSAGQLGSVSADLGSGGASADLGGSAVRGSLVAIGTLSGHGGGGGGGGTGPGLGGSGGGGGQGGGPGGSGAGGYGSGGGGPGGSGWGGGGAGGGGTGGSGGSGSAPGVYRSNASLLAVIQKYAAGIQYCYGNELKRDETLSGKLVVALTVAASGEVLEATVVENTVGSQRLAACALSQIRDWRFPPIERGVTAFQAPFVFTPPR